MHINFILLLPRVVGRRVPIDDLDALNAFRIAVSDRHAVLEQIVHLAVGLGGGQEAAVAGNFFDGELQGRFRQAGIELV